MRGKLIVFEGVEGCGKTTQIKALQTWLPQSLAWQQLQQQYITSIFVTREPGGTPLGKVLRRLLLTQSEQDEDFDIASRTELLLYAADRAQHVDEFLLPHLRQGSLVICDRFTDSTVAYQGYGRGLDLGLIHQLNQIATQGLQSDLTVWLDLDVEIGLTRMQARGSIDRIENSDVEFHRRVQQGFQALAQAFPERIVRIDASGEEAAVAQRVQLVLEERFRTWYPDVSFF